MIMKRKLAIAALIALFAQVALQAQDLTNAESRRINLKVLNTLEQYERSAALSDEEQIYMFKELFPSLESTQVVLDIMGAENYMGTVSVQKYMDVVAASTFGLDIKIYNVRKGNVTFDEGVWKIPLRFKKEMSYVDNNSIWFSTDEYYDGARYDVTMNIIYDPASDICQIASISESIDSSIQFPQGRFYVLRKDDNLSKRDKKFENTMFTYNKLTYNDFNQVFVEKDDLKPWHGDVRVKYDSIQKPYPQVGNYDFVKIKCDKLKLRGRAYFSMTLPIPVKGLFSGGAFLVETDDAKIKSKSSAMEYGIEIGRAALLGKNGKWGAFNYNVGVALSNTTLELSADNISYGYNTVAPNGMRYTRHYNIKSVKEKVKYNNLVVPVSVGWDFFGKRRVQVGLSVGAKMYFSLAHDKGVVADPMEVDGTVTAWDGNKELTEYSEFLAPTSYSNDFSCSLTGGFYLSVRALDFLYPYIKVSAEYGLDKFGLEKYHEKTQNKYYDSNGTYPFVYSAQADKDIAVKSLISCVDLTRRALWAEVGVRFKF